MHAAIARCLSVAILLAMFGGVSLAAAPRPSLDELEATLLILKRSENEQRQNILAMQQELKDAAAQKRIPDISKLKHYATATGQRTEAYRQAPKQIQALIDAFEHRTLANMADAFRLGIASIIGGKLGHAIRTYQIEIKRSEYFITILRREEERAVKQITDMKAAPVSPLDLQHARFDDAIEQIEKGIGDLESIRKHIQDNYEIAQALHDGLAKNADAANTLSQALISGMTQVNELVGACRDSSDIAGGVALHAAELISDIGDAGKALGQARLIVGKCESASSVQAGLKQVQAGKKLAKIASDHWKKIQEGEGILEKLKGLKSQAEKMRAALDEKIRDIDALSGKVWEGVSDLLPAAWKVTSLCNTTLPDRKDALFRLIEKTRDAFASDDPRAQAKLDALRKELAADEPAHDVVMKIDALITGAKRYERKMADMEKDVSEYRKGFDARILPCSEIKIPEEIIHEAAEALSSFGLSYSDMGKETEADAKLCLALLERGGKPAGASGLGGQDKASGSLTTESLLPPAKQPPPGAEQKTQPPETAPGTGVSARQKRLFLESAGVTPKAGNVGEKIIFTISYGVEGVLPNETLPAELTLTVPNAATLSMSNHVFTIDGSAFPAGVAHATISANATFDKPGAYVWNYTVRASGLAPLTGSLPISIKEKQAEEQRERKAAIVSAEVSPNAGKIGEKILLRITFAVEGLLPNEKLSARSGVTITGAQTLPFPKRSLTIDGAAANKGRVTADIAVDAALAKPGEYAWEYAIDIDGFDALKGSVPFSIKSQESEPAPAAAPRDGGQLSGTGTWNDGPYGGPITVSITLDPNSGGGTWTAQFSGGGRATAVSGSASGQVKGSANSASLSGRVQYRVSTRGAPTVNLGGSIRGSLSGSQIKGSWSSGGDAGTFTATVQ